MNSINKIFKSKYLKVASMILFIAVVLAGVLYALVYISNETASVTAKQDTVQEYGNGITLKETTSVQAKRADGAMKVAVLNADGEIEEESRNSSAEAATMTKEELETLRDEQIESILSANGLTMYEFVNYKESIADSVLVQIQKVLDEYDKKMDVVMANQGVNGKDGKDGKDGATGKTGAAGKDGKDGKAGATGRTGATGKTGATGATGKTGPAGRDGEAGKDGKNVYVKYAKDINGTGMTSTPTSETKYIGTYTGTSEPTSASAYLWSRMTGETGEAGADGQNVFIKYAEDASGTGMSATPNDRTKYIGTYSGATEPTSASDYSWSQYRDLIITFDESTNTLLIH